jgi:flagellar motor switch protein FliG
MHALPDSLQHRVKQALEAAGEVSSEQIEAAQRRIVAVARAL